MSQATRILLALVLGLALGLISARAGGAWVENAVAIAEPVGGLWLNALRMTIVPLVVSLLITGIAASAAAARASRLAGRAIVLFILLLWASSGFAMLLTPLLLDLWPLAPDAAAALRGALATTDGATQAPGLADFLSSILPSNPVAAAAEDAILPLILFTIIFAFALSRLPAEPRALLNGFFRAVADVMLVMVGWILWVGPIGVLALAYVVGVRAGGAAFGALLHYVIILSVVGIVVWLLSFLMGAFGGRMSLPAFVRALGPTQAVAISTQSSLASLPAMLRSAERIGVPVQASGLVLPLAVAMFRITGPAMNLAVVIYIAHVFGITLGPAQIAAGVAAAAITTMGAAGIPGQASFVTSIAPICIAMGVPLEPLALLIAVETIPDIFRTMGNVTMDVAVTTTLSKRSGFDEEDETEQDHLLMGESGPA